MHLDELRDGRGDSAEIASLLLSDGEAVLSPDGQAEFLGIVAPLIASDSTAKIEDVVRAATRVVEADEKHLNVGYRLSIWRRAIDASAPGLPIIMIEQRGESRKPATVPCPRCTIVSSEDVDENIFELFTGGSEVTFQSDDILLADRAGKLAFNASLSETARASEFAARAKVLAATK